MTAQCSIWGTVIVKKKPKLFELLRTFGGEHYCVISLFHVMSYPFIIEQNHWEDPGKGSRGSSSFRSAKCILFQHRVVPLMTKNILCLIPRLRSGIRKLQLLEWLVKTFYSDHGGECNAMIDFLKEQDLENECSAPYTPQQNRTAKRLNWAFLDLLRSILI